ncbi:MAG: TRAP transporter substrate-binding protein DctP [Myxococcota bacterium]|nr:TRAP transporter substrate-binding protein DctP [Myxococcota bacterium]
MNAALRPLATLRLLPALRLLAVLGLAALCALAPPDVGAQQAEPQHVMRLGSLMPRNAVGRRGMARWNRMLAEATDGRLQVRMYWGGSMGDERTMVRRMRIGSLDAASLTSTGLSIIHRPVLVMQAPGIFSSYAQVDAVRREIGPEMARALEGQGYGLLGWGDAGRVRLFSKEPLRRPTDLRRMRPWVPRTDAVFRQMLSVVGANGVPLGVGEVFGGLRTGMIDVAPGTALAVAGLQWFTSLSYATAQSDGFLIGGMVVRRPFLDQLSAEDRAALFEIAEQNHERLLRQTRRADERAFQALTRHGIQPVDVEAHRGEWQRVADQTRQQLAGRVFPRELLTRVEAIAARTR